MSKLTKINNNYEKEFLLVEYFMGNLCNHRCSYCFPGSNEGTQQWPDVDIVTKNIGYLLEKYKAIGKSTFDFYLIGGEPTLYKDLDKLCTVLKQYGANIRISTNGSRGLDWWHEHVKYFDQIEISVHNEYADIPHLIDVCDLIYSYDKQVVANVLMDPNNFD
jgi:organic radical activating enzyme